MNSPEKIFDLSLYLQHQARIVPPDLYSRSVSLRLDEIGSSASAKHRGGLELCVS